MPIFRGIFLIAALWLALLLFRQLYRSHQQNRQRSAHKNLRSTAFSQTIACDNCRTHIPKTETIHQDGRYFCSADCRQQHYSQ